MKPFVRVLPVFVFDDRPHCKHPTCLRPASYAETSDADPVFCDKHKTAAQKNVVHPNRYYYLYYTTIPKVWYVLVFMYCCIVFVIDERKYGSIHYTTHVAPKAPESVV